MTEVREIALSARIFDRCAMTSSVMPSAKYSFSGSALKFWNGSTATEGACARPVAGALSAFTKSATDANRSTGSLAMALARASSTSAGTSDRRRRTEGTGSTRRFVMIDWAVDPVYGGSPASIS